MLYILNVTATAQDREDISDDDEDADEDVDMDSEEEGDVALNIRSLVGGTSRNKRAKETSTSASPPPASRMRTGA
jgi:hypothetical protein